MMDKFAIFDYAEKGALADYEKACMMYKLFQDEKSKAAMNQRRKKREQNSIKRNVLQK